MRADALIKRNKVQKLGNRAHHRYLFALIHPAGYLLNIPIIHIAAHKVYNTQNNHSTKLIHGGYQSCATTTLIRAIPPSPKSYITAVVANCAETSLNRPTATSLSPADAELARLTEDMIISGGVSPHRIVLKNCQL